MNRKVPLLLIYKEKPAYAAVNILDRTSSLSVGSIRRASRSGQINGIPLR
jgi:hypothetical protein